jgi:glycosyltransferase involved in cell wall biosynthesis
MMRVACHAGQLLQPIPGGIGRYVRELLGRLPDVGVEPVAFAAGARPARAPARVPWIDLGPPHGSARYELWNRLRRPLVRIDADLVHAPSLVVPPVRGMPLAVTVHDVAFLRFPDATTRRGESFHRHGLERARREATLVLAPSTFTRVELLREGFAPDDVVVAPLGVQPPEARDDAEVDGTVAHAGVTAPYLLTVGTVEPRKDLPTIVEVLQRLRRSRPELELVVAGPPGWGAVDGLDRPGVRVLGPQPWRVVDALYRRAEVCVVASRYEGFGLPALEALAHGAPLIAADGSSLTEVVDDAGVLFPPGDVDALHDAVARLLEDPDARADLARRGPERAATLTWAASAAAHADAFALTIERFHATVPPSRAGEIGWE